MKKLLSILLLCAMLAASLASCAPEQGLLDPDFFHINLEEDLSYASQPAWNGTEKDTSWYSAGASTYTLSDGADLRGFVELIKNNGVTFEGKTVTLKNSINLGGKTWTSPTSSNVFLGTFDGVGHTIGNYKMTCSVNDQSLLGRVGGGATVKNLKIADASVMLSTSAERINMGILFSIATTQSGKTLTLKDLSVNAAVIDAASSKAFNAVGGLIGTAEGDGILLIESCSFAGSLKTAGEQAGGMVGYITGSTTAQIKSCTNKGSVSAMGKIGGMVGCFAEYSGNATVEGCTNEGALTILSASDAGQAGGMIGRFAASKGSVTISNCGNTGALTYKGTKGGGSWMGGIGGYFVGENGTIDSISVTNCYSTGAITANRTSGGLLGFMQTCKKLTVSNCSVDADITFLFNSAKNPYSGGLVGMINLGGANTMNSYLATITNCSVDGTITVQDVLDANSYTGGLLGGLRTTTVNATDCEVRSTFTKLECEEDDAINVVLGFNQDNKAVLTPTNLTYHWKNEVAKAEEYLIPSGDSVIFKTLGVQTRSNVGADGTSGTGDDTCDLRYVFGVRNLTDKTPYVGFVLETRTLGAEVKLLEQTEYASYVYEDLMISGKKTPAKQYNVDYFLTLTLSGIPKKNIEPGDNGMPYIKDTLINVYPFSSTSDTADVIPGVGIESYGLTPDQYIFEMRQFSPVLPEKFEGVAGIITANNISYPDALGTACQRFQKIHATNEQYNLKYACNCGGNCAWSANGTTAYRLNANVPYHYYIDTTSYAAQFDEELDRYEAYHTWSFEVAEDGYYEFCFRIRLNGSDGAMQTRYALLQLDDASYGEQTELYYSITVRDGTLRDNATNHDAYLVGYGAELSAGKHTLTFRLPYNGTGIDKSASFHFRDIYVVKGAKPVNQAPVPLPAGTVTYDGNFNENTCTYAINNASYDVYTAYIKTLTDAGFVLRETRKNEYEYLSFDAPNYKEGGDNDRFNEFHLFTNEDYMVHAYFLEGPKKIRVIVSDVEAYEDYAAVSAQNAKSYETVTTPMFASLDIADYVAQGMCFVFRLSDGRFILIDGGQWEDSRTTKDATLLYEYLKSKSPNGKVVIATWIITHLHSDHMNIAWLFEQMYGKEVEIQSYMYNFPSYEYARSMPSSNLKVDYYTKRYPMMHELMDRYTNLVEHTGFVYQFADCTIEILYTHEDFYPEHINSFNNSNNALKITLGGKSFLIAGDLEEPGQKACNKQTGTLLDSDFLQITHHGYNGQIEFYKYIVNNELEDTVVLWTLPNQKPSPNYNLAANKWLKENVKQIHFPYEDREYDLSN